ncbi:MAG: hypothetical protein E2O86_04090 [Bacteroidetes bacterium]|jgi:hypothetical protein|nr:MAG: hypothetical protein E2O86_04090 [Bacteroidota bacterium]|tara:strand:+ start:216 stop:722 length:507 start_codon:yes stop_codon:yes gene_type:complete
MEKTHYRKVFKSDHLGVADLEDLIETKSNMIFTIREVKQENGVRVAGKKGNFNIAYFNESIKPLVLNAGNSKVVKKLAGGSSFIEDWKGLLIQLYIDPKASFAGEVTGGVRISPNPPKQKITITQENPKLWQNAINAYVRDGNFNAVLERADITKENQDLIIKECANV